MRKIKLTLVIVSIILFLSAMRSVAQTLPLDDFVPYEMPAPPMKASFVDSYKAIKLTQLSVNPNDIIDVTKWYWDNELYIPCYDTPNGQFPIAGFMKPSSVIPKQLDALKMFGGVKSAEANCYLYGTDGSNVAFLLISDVDNTEILHFLDFNSYLNPVDFYKMSLNWAVVENNVLYVSNTHRGYASVTNNINAFITAIDLKTMQIIWRSEPLVSNANNFEIIGDNIVCGYGFTAEPDYIYILNKYTGRKTGTIKVASAPDYIVVKDDKLYVRTYNRDYVYKIE